MYKNRIAFICLWMLGVIVLICFPGFEIRGLALGLIAGYLPFIVLSCFNITLEHSHPLTVYLAMFVFSGTFVALTAWLMDKTKQFKGYLCLLVISITIGFGIFASGGYNYETWKRSTPVQQAMEAPEVQFQPTHWEYNKQIAIPKAISGCLFGLYFASLIGGTASTVILLKRRFGKSGSQK